MSKEKTFLFYDLETGDIDTQTTRVSQYSSIRVDENLNIIEEKNYYCEPMLDYIPSPYANLVTKVTPIDILEIKQKNPEKVLKEYELYKMLNKDFNVAGTCTVGFNNLRYDDEIVRRGFYRNLFPVYDREFKNNCSRFDIFPMVKLFASLYKKDFIVPILNGKKTMKLEHLAKENGFKVDGLYHDALTDVRATIFLAKKMKEISKEFWNLAMFLKNKNNLSSYLTVNQKQPFILESNFLGSAKNFTTLVYVLCTHPNDKNKFIAIDLKNQAGVKRLLNANSPDDLKDVYNLNKSGFIDIEINKFPAIVSVNDLEKINLEPIDLSKYDSVINKLNSDKIKNILLEKFNKPYQNKPLDLNANPDFGIYKGFPTQTDSFRFLEFHKDLENGLFDKYLDDTVNFEDMRYAELAKNVIKRNFLDRLNDPKYQPLKKEWGKSNIFIYNNKYVEKYNDQKSVIPFDKNSIIEIINNFEKDPNLKEEDKEILNKYKKSINYYFNQSKQLYTDNSCEEEIKKKRTVKIKCK